MKAKVVKLSGGAAVPALLGAIVGWAVTVLVIMLCAVIFTLADASPSLAAPMATVAASAGAAVGGFCTARLLRRRGMAMGALTGLIMFIVLMLVSVLAGSTEFTINTPVRALAMIILSALGGIVGVNRSQKRKMI